MVSNILVTLLWKEFRVVCERYWSLKSGIEATQMQPDKSYVSFKVNIVQCQCEF